MWISLFFKSSVKRIQWWSGPSKLLQHFPSPACSISGKVFLGTFCKVVFYVIKWNILSHSCFSAFFIFYPYCTSHWRWLYNDYLFFWELPPSVPIHHLYVLCITHLSHHLITLLAVQIPQNSQFFNTSGHNNTSRVISFNLCIE